MRDYGKTGYGSLRDNYTQKTDPLRNVRERPAGDRRPGVPADVLVRGRAGGGMPPPMQMPGVRNGAAPGFDPSQWIQMLLGAMKDQGIGIIYDTLRYCNFRSIVLNVGQTDQSILRYATLTRTYLFLICTHPTQDLFINFGAPATPLNCPIRSGDGFFEWLFVVPQDEIHLIASGGGTTGVAIFAERDPAVVKRMPWEIQAATPVDLGAPRLLFPSENVQPDATEETPITALFPELNGHVPPPASIAVGEPAPPAPVVSTAQSIIDIAPPSPPPPPVTRPDPVFDVYNSRWIWPDTGEEYRATDPYFVDFTQS